MLEGSGPLKELLAMLRYANWVGKDGSTPLKLLKATLRYVKPVGSAAGNDPLRLVFDTYKAAMLDGRGGRWPVNGQ
jgi:hypothetical protein